MALIKCYECGAEISDAATSCPQCGAPQSKPKKQSATTRRKTVKPEHAIVEDPTLAPAEPEEVKDWKYYLKRIGGFIGILIFAKIISKIILMLVK